MVNQIAEYLWGQKRLNLSNKEWVGGPGKYKSFIVGKVVVPELLDLQLRQFMLEEVVVKLRYKSIKKLGISIYSFINHDLRELARYGTIDDSEVIKITSLPDHRFIVGLISSSIENNVVVSWEPMRPGQIRIHGLRHFKEICIDA